MPSRLSRILPALVVTAALVTVGSLVSGVGSFALARMIGTNEGAACTAESRAEIRALFLRLGNPAGPGPMLLSVSSPTTAWQRVRVTAAVAPVRRSTAVELPLPP